MGDSNFHREYFEDEVVFNLATALAQIKVLLVMQEDGAKLNIPAYIDRVFKKNLVRKYEHIKAKCEAVGETYNRTKQAAG